MPTTQNVDTFKRILRNLESALYRRDSGQLTGRNDSSSQQGLRGHLRRLHEMVLHCDDVADELDSNERLAARYSKAERRVYNLPL